MGEYANLFANIDKERERFLDFERWWNGFYFLSRGEMLDIVRNLFIGNSLEQTKLQVCPGCFVDLRRIRNPLVIFASYGDNITPPHQALGWIPAVYSGTADLKQAGQRIVYLINPHVGHLGIFVSASVARLEHRAILDSLERIKSLPAGLYEMKIDNPTGDPDCDREAYAVRFEERRVGDLSFRRDSDAFERVADVSQMLDDLYSTMASTWVRAISTSLSAQALEWLHPMRFSRYVFATGSNPWQGVIAQVASGIARDRHVAPDDNPLKAIEKKNIETIGKAIEAWRRLRDVGYEQAFNALYGNPSDNVALAAAEMPVMLE